MTTFPNFGLINQMSKHLANNTSPRILDYTMSDYNGYRYTPSSTDIASQPLVTNSISQQQRFNAMAEQLMYNDNRSNNDVVNHNISHQNNMIDNLVNPPQTIQPQSQQVLNTTAPRGIINDMNENKESFIIGDSLVTGETRNKFNIIRTIIIVFVVFMLIQLYLSQKKLEFMMNIYQTTHPLMNPANNIPLQQKEIF